MHVTNQAPISVLHSRFSFTFQKLVSTKQAFFLASRSNARCYVSVKFSAFCSQPRFDLLYYQSRSAAIFTAHNMAGLDDVTSHSFVQAVDPAHRGHFPLEANSENLPCPLTSVQ